VKRRPLSGAVEAATLGLIVPLPVGPAQIIKETAAAAGIDLDGQEIDVSHSKASAAKAVELIREGRAEILMKGSLHTDEHPQSILTITSNVVELAINYTLQDVEPPTNEMIERACEQFRAVGLTAY